MVVPTNSCQPIGRIAAALVILSTAASPRFTAHAAEPVVPPAVQAALTLRILEYDRALKTWAGSSLRVGLVAQSGADDEYRKGLEGQKAQGIAVSVSQTSPGGGVDAWIQREGVRMIYVAPGVSADDAAAVAAAARSAKLPVLTVTRAHFDRGATLGIVVKDSKPHILVRLPVAREAGMDLDPKLLRLAELVQ